MKIKIPYSLLFHNDPSGDVVFLRCKQSKIQNPKYVKKFKLKRNGEENI